MKVKKEDEDEDDGYWVSSNWAPRTMPLSPRLQGGRVKERVWQLQVNHLRSLIATRLQRGTRGHRNKTWVSRLSVRVCLGFRIAVIFGYNYLNDSNIRDNSGPRWGF